jgi:hypothetical protein
MRIIVRARSDLIWPHVCIVSHYTSSESFRLLKIIIAESESLLLFASMGILTHGRAFQRDVSQSTWERSAASDTQSLTGYFPAFVFFS